MIWCGDSLAELLVNGLADLFDGSPLVVGEPEKGEAAQVADAPDRLAGHDTHDAFGVLVTDKNAAFPVKVVDVTYFRPIGRPGRRAFQSFRDIGYPVQDQINLRCEPSAPLVTYFAINGHFSPPFKQLIDP